MNIETAQCPFCEGTGRVEVKQCAEIVKGRLCRHLAMNDPAYFKRYPDRADLKVYCTMHANARIRYRAAAAT